MEYVVSNMEVVRDPLLRQRLEADLTRQAVKLDILPARYRETEVWRIFLSRLAEGGYRLSCALRLDSGVAFASVAGEDMIELPNRLFDDFRRRLSERLRVEKSPHFHQGRSRTFEQFSDYLDELRSIRSAQDHPTFATLVTLLLPNLYGYLRRRLQVAEAAGSLPAGQYRPQTLLDEVIARVYEDFERCPSCSDNFNFWMLKEADQLMEEILGLAGMAEPPADIPEWLTAEGRWWEPVWMSEQEKTGQTYRTREIIIALGRGDELLPRLDAPFKEVIFDDLLNREMARMPALQHAVFDLFVLEQLSPHDIAGIKGLTPGQVDTLIGETYHHLEQQIEDWTRDYKISHLERLS